MDYVYLRAWDRMMGSFQYWTDANLKKARRENAPADAIYNTAGIVEGGKWRTFAQCEREDTRQIIANLVKEMQEDG